MGWWGVTTPARVSREDFLEEVVLEKIGNGEKDQPDGDLQKQPSRHRKEQGALFWVRTLGPVRRRDLSKATGQRSTAELAEAGATCSDHPGSPGPLGVRQTLCTPAASARGSSRFGDHRLLVKKYLGWRPAQTDGRYSMAELGVPQPRPLAPRPDGSCRRRWTRGFLQKVSGFFPGPVESLTLYRSHLRAPSPLKILCPPISGSASGNSAQERSRGGM